MIAKACYVRCDECGVPAEVVVEGAKEARKVAAREGFVRVGKRDLCSRCSRGTVAVSERQGTAR
jgi:hypothetical protein